MEGSATVYTTPVVTFHARQRSRQRGVSARQIALVRAHGRRHYGRGATHYFFGRREAARHRAILGRETEGLEGIVVVIGFNGDVLTVYRNDRAAKYLRRGIC